MDPKRHLDALVEIARALGLDVSKTGDGGVVISIPAQPPVNYCWCGHPDELHDGPKACLDAECDCMLWSPRGMW